MTKVKICGITNFKDAETALSCGADALGFVFAESPRKISALKAGDICKRVGPWTVTVGVFVGQTADQILTIADRCGLNCLQIYADEKLSGEKKLHAYSIMKAFRIGSEADLLQTQGACGDLFLFDTKVNGQWGGTGKLIAWDILKNYKAKKPMVISGGLNPRNVRPIIRALSPYGVDVSSGVESAPGKKDAKLIKKFIRYAKNS